MKLDFTKYLSSHILAFIGNICFLCVVFIFIYNEFSIKFLNILPDFIIDNYTFISVINFLFFIILFVEYIVFQKCSKQIIHFEVKNRFWDFIYDFLFHSGLLFATIKFLIDIYMIFLFYNF